MSTEEEESRDLLLSNKIIAELYLRELQLNAVLEITQSINQNAKTEDLLSIYEHFLRDELKIGKLLLFTRHTSTHGNIHTWRTTLFYGANPELKKLDVVNVFSKVKYPKEVDPNDKLLNEFSTILPVYHKEHALAYVLIGDYQNKDLNYNDDVLPFIQLITNIIIVANENKRFAKEQLRQAGVRKEMELAAKMQTMLFPKAFPENPSFEIFSTYLPHHEVGGDYYDYYMLNDKELLFCIADVSGKGVSAALLMSNFQANLHALVKNFSNLHNLINDLNSTVMEIANGEKHISFFIGIINTETHVLTYVNAGHPPPIVCNNKECELLNSGTTGLGMFETLPFLSIGYTKLSDKSTILCYTDGAMEAENKREEQFGIDGIHKYMQEHSTSRTLQNMHDHLIESLKTFSNQKPFNDDVSLLSCRYKI